MKRPTLYYETRSGLPAFGDIMHAIDGFESLGFNCEAFSMNESRSPICLYPTHWMWQPKIMQV